MRQDSSFLIAAQPKVDKEVPAYVPRYSLFNDPPYSAHTHTPLNKHTARAQKTGFGVQEHLVLLSH